MEVVCTKFSGVDAPCLEMCRGSWGTGHPRPTRFFTPFTSGSIIPRSLSCSFFSQMQLPFVFETCRLGKISEPGSCRWLIKVLFLFSEQPQSRRASACLLFISHFCQYAFIWWLYCLKSIWCVFRYGLDVFVNIFNLFPLSNRPFYLPDLLLKSLLLHVWCYVDYSKTREFS